MQTCRPIVEDKRQGADARSFHRAVFAYWGRFCWFAPGNERDHYADDAGHVIDKNQLGPLRYATVDFARPVCRRHHNMLHAGTLRWTIYDRQRAVRAHNKIAKQRLPVPRSARTHRREVRRAV